MDIVTGIKIAVMCNNFIEKCYEEKIVSSNALTFQFSQELQKLIKDLLEKGLDEVIFQKSSLLNNEVKNCLS